MRSSTLFALPVLTIAAATLWACSGDSTAPPIVDPIDEIEPRVAVAMVLAPSTLTLLDGRSGSIASSAYDQAGSLINGGLAIAWSSSDPTVATVADGRVSALHPGATQITATVGSLSATANVLVTPAPTHVSYVIGTGQAGTAASILPDSLVVLVLDRQGMAMVGAEIDFVTNSGGKISPTTATTDDSGYARAEWTLGPLAGAQTAEARGAGLGGSPVLFTAAASPDVAASIDIAADTIALPALGATAQLAAVALDASGNETAASLEWSSLDAGVATTSDAGLITATGAGTTQIVARSGELADTVTVVVARAVATVLITPSSATLNARETLKLKAVALDAEGVEISREDFTWRSSNEAVATVSSTGEVTGLRPGTVTIGVKMDGVIGAVALVVPGIVNE